MDGGSRTGRDSTQAHGEEARSIRHGAGLDGYPLHVIYAFSYFGNTVDKVTIQGIFYGKNFPF